MKQNAPTPSLTIKIVTSAYIALTVGLLVSGCFFPLTLLVGGLLVLLGLYCYLFWSPVAYELADNTLTVFFRASRK